MANLYAGKLKGWSKVKKTLAAQGLSHDLVVKYQDANGKKRWKGSSKLRSSQYATYLFGPLVQFAFILHSTKTCVEKNIGFAMHMFPQWFSLCLYMNANNSERIMYVVDFFHQTHSLIIMSYCLNIPAQFGNIHELCVLGSLSWQF